ncbi:unnamed protein product, partial [Aphanomyces euteiches]
TQATGEVDHQRVVEIEIIFGHFDEIDCLDECPNLCNLTRKTTFGQNPMGAHIGLVIQCRLQRISRLEPVAHTLTRLCLADQELTKIEGLCLPNLRQLLLHNNHIRVIENLEGVPKLQKLWLHSNSISTIENLHGCTDLRELWLQDNNISALGGLDQLTNLHNLALSKNYLSHFEELAKLSHLPNLCSLTLSDEDFGSNPITRESGYRLFVINQLKQVRILDGLEIQTKDQRAAEEEYMKRVRVVACWGFNSWQVLDFNDKIDTVQREHEQEMLSIDSRRNRNSSHAELLKQELLTAFRALEDLVTSGRKTVQDEHTRQQVIRAKYATALQHKLESIQQEYLAQMDALIAAETAAMAHHEELFEILEARIAAEEAQALAVASIQRSTTTSFQHLSDSTPDFRYIASLFLNRHAHDMKVLQLYKCHTTTQFEPTSRSPPLFLAGSTSHIQEFFHDQSARSSSWYTTDPYLAAFLATKHNQPPSPDHNHMLVCLCNAVQVADLHLPSLSSWEELWQALATDNSTCAASTWTKVHFKLSSDKHSGAIYVPPVAATQLEITPQYYAVCSITRASIDEAELQQLLQDAASVTMTPGQANGLDQTADNLLTQCNQQMQQEVETYQRQLWDDLNPDRRRGADDVQCLQQALSQLRSRIQEEQNTQKSILRDLQKQRKLQQ